MDIQCFPFFSYGHSLERLIGVAHQILDGILLQSDKSQLTHKMLTTLMAEVMAILNARLIRVN